VRDGFKEIVAVPMAPFRSRASTGAYMEELNRVKGEVGAGIQVFFVEGWYRHPLFVKAIQEKVEKGLGQFTSEERKRVHLIFTAHSLLKSLIENDPYVREIEESVAEVLKGLGPMPWRIAFQSKGGGPGEWIGPEVERVLEDLASQKAKEVLVVPIGFVSDHIEILYDIDILYRNKAESLGMKLKRIPSLNASESFVKALSTIVEENLKGFKDSRGQGV
jgi:ferrochelatase